MNFHAIQLLVAFSSVSASLKVMKKCSLESVPGAKPEAHFREKDLCVLAKSKWEDGLLGHELVCLLYIR